MPQAVADAAGGYIRMYIISSRWSPPCPEHAQVLSGMWYSHEVAGFGVVLVIVRRLVVVVSYQKLRDQEWLDEVVFGQHRS